MKGRILTFALLLTVLAAGPAAAASFDATVQWARRVELGTPVSGIVKNVSADIGERVNKDKVLMALDDTPFKAEMTQAEAAVKSTHRSRLEALRALNRAKDLYERQVLATVTLDHARLDFIKADSAYRQAQARSELAKYRLDHASVRMPFDGVVVDRHVEVGQDIVANFQAPVLFVVAEAERYLARALVPGGELAGLKPGESATVDVGGKSYTGKIKTIGVEPVADKGSGKPLYAVDVHFDTPGVLLRAGTAATVKFP